MERWVGDQLHDLIGYSDKVVAQYIIATAKRAQNAQGLLRALTADGTIEKNARSQQFTVALWDKVGLPTQAVPSAAKLASRMETRKAIEMQRKTQSYRLIENDDNNDNDNPGTKALSKKDIRKKHTRKREDTIGSGSPNAIAPKRSKTKQIIDYDDVEEQERARAADLADRDAFAERLKDKDKAKQGKIGGASSKRAAEIARRREDERLADRSARMKELREEARWSYLDDRKDRIFEALQDDVNDYETIFSGVMTETEKKRLDRDKKTLQIVKEYNDLDRKMREEVEGYDFPDQYVDEHEGRRDKMAQNAVLTTRYQEKLEEGKGPSWEQAAWEEDQMRLATMKVGTKGAKEAMKAEGKLQDEDYEFVFEDLEQTFIMTETAKGSCTEEKDKKETATEARKQSMKEVRESLPVFPYREDFLKAVKEHQVLIVVAETGSGKTTQLPQYLWEDGFCKDGKMVGCTQPRRVAAMSVAARVADESATTLGREVGYSIRFEDCTSEKTVLKYMTDGMLLREFLSEPDLAAYACIMVDEAHERTLHTDVLFGLVKDIAAFRPDLRLLISSATLDAEKFSTFFDDAPIFQIPGRRYDVDIMYTKAPEADYIDAVVVTVLQIHLTQPAGDVLVFLSGQDEIESCEQALTERVRKLGSKIAELLVLPIYANLPSDMQAKIFESTPLGSRKVVLGTNIAETSLTIDGIIYVIDPGFCKQKSYNPRSGMESLIVTPCSQASANQRAGRAGRVAAGKCFRLYTAWAFQNELEENTIPEIQRTNLGNVVLLLKSLGINDLIHFDFMDPPPAETLIRALEQLYALGALNDRGELTKMGRRMAEFPLDPMLSKCLIVAEKYEVVEEVLSITAMLQIGGALFYRPKDRAVHADNARTAFNHQTGDHMTLLKIWNEWEETEFSTQWCFENFIQHRSMNRARDVREQLVNLMERVEIKITSTPDNTVNVRKAVLAGFFYNTARLGKGGVFRTVKQQQSVQIHPTSSLHTLTPRWLVFFELVFTTKEFMRQVTEIDSKWLIEVAPHYYKPKEIDDTYAKKMPKGQGRSESRMEIVDVNPYGPGVN